MPRFEYYERFTKKKRKNDPWKNLSFQKFYFQLNPSIALIKPILSSLNSARYYFDY